MWSSSQMVRTLEIPLDADEERLYTYLFWRSHLEFNSFIEHSENLHRMKVAGRSSNRRRHA